MRCTHCEAENPPSARYCGHCGQALAAVCPSCLAPVAAGLRFCTACGHDLQRAPVDAHAPPPAPAPTADEGERRQATVVFADLAGYTALNETRDPEDVEALLARIKQSATTLVERHGGIVNQFVGDEVMALFGVPLAHRDDARNAVAAALDLHAAVQTIVREAGLASSLALHTGINTGLVVVRKSYARAGAWTCTGDAVNVAARLRSAAPPGEILVGAETRRQVEGAYDGQPQAAVNLKGKELPVVPWRIVGARAASPALEHERIVGRDEELAQFRALVDACTERRRGRVAVVRGDPGVGKSRFVAECLALASARGCSTHAAAVLDFGAETGRDAVRTLARSLAGVAPQADESERRAAAQRAAEDAGFAPEQRLFLHDLLDLAAGPDLRSLADAMSLGAREQGSLATLCELVRVRAAQAPLVLAVEDIHWADAWTLERLAALATLAARQPLLLMLTTRFEGDPTAGAWRTALHGAPLVGLDLGPLGDDDALQLAAATSRMPAEVVQRCVARAEGNPLFLLQLLLDVNEAATSHLPGSIQALVHARMDRLAPADKAALQAASVLGQRYSLDAWRHVLDQPAYDGQVLVEHYLVRREGEELAFCHALIRDGAYASLLHARRRGLHARAAGWFGERDPALAAEHYERADDPRAAGTYLVASRASMRQQRFPTALALAERGLGLAHERDVRFELLMQRARLLAELGRTPEALEAAEAARDAAAQPLERAQALIAMAGALRLADRIQDGLAALREAEPLAAGSPLDLARLHHLRGNLLFPLGRAGECLREHERARDAARAAGSHEAEAEALGGLGDAHYLHGRMRSAHEQFEACVALAQRHGYGRLQVSYLPMVGWAGYQLAAVDDAVERGLEAIELASRAEQARAQLLARMLVAWVEGLLRDRVDIAEIQLAEALGLVERLGARRFEGQLHGVSALLARRRGDLSVARASAARGLAIGRAHGMGHIGPWLLGVNALLAEDPAERRRLLDEGEVELTRGSVSHNHIELRELAIEVALELGDWPAVETACTRMHAYMEAEPIPLAQLRIARARALARHGQGERGAELQDEMRRIRDAAVAANVRVDVPALDRALAEASTS